MDDLSEKLREELYAEFNALRQHVEEQLNEISEMYQPTYEAFAEAFALIGRAAKETIDAVFGAFAAMFEEVMEAEKKTETPRRNWTRPRNQKLQPLLLDRRNRVFHCRNAI